MLQEAVLHLGAQLGLVKRSDDAGHLQLGQRPDLLGHDDAVQGVTRNSRSKKNLESVDGTALTPEAREREDGEERKVPIEAVIGYH